MKLILIIAVLTAIVLSEGSEYDNRVLLKDDVVRIYAEVLYNKRSTISTLLQWNSDLFHGFQHINGIKPYKITESTRVHVVGHSTKATKTTVGNCNAEQIGNILSLLTSQSNVKRISLVSCTLHDPSSTSGASESFAGHHRSVTTELSVRTAPVGFWKKVTRSCEGSWAKDSKIIATLAENGDVSFANVEYDSAEKEIHLELEELGLYI